MFEAGLDDLEHATPTDQWDTGKGFWGDEKKNRAGRAIATPCVK
jgi:hypothetical protein